MASHLRVSAGARTDLNETINWYQSQNPPTAERFLTLYSQAVSRILKNPRFYPLIRGKKRKARIDRPFPYSIFFTVKGDLVTIIAVFHDKRNPSIWQKR